MTMMPAGPPSPRGVFMFIGYQVQQCSHHPDEAAPWEGFFFVFIGYDIENNSLPFEGGILNIFFLLLLYFRS